MIVTEFYPTLTTIGDDMLITDTVTAQHVTDKDTDPAKAYYMGEVDPDASLLRTGTFKAEKSGEDISTYSYKFEQDYSVRAKWLYMTSNTGNYLYFNYLNGRWDSNFKFFNGFAPNKMNLTYTMQLTLNLRLYDFVNEHTLGNGEHVFTNNNSWDKTINLSGNVLYEFFEEGLTYNTNINGVQYQLTYDGYDVNEHCWKFDNGMRIYITGATVDPNTASSIYYSNNYIRCNVINSIELPEDGGYHNYNDEAIDRPMCASFIDTFYFYPSDNRLDLTTHKFGFHIGLYNDPSLYVYNGGKVVLRGGAPFEISYIAANYAASSNQEVVTSNGALLHATGQQTLRVNGFVDLVSIYHSGWGNHPKHVTSRDKDGNEISSYSSNTSQYEKYDDVPIFDANNVFLYRVKENKYKDLEPDLQPWQKYGADISDNDYDPDDSGGGGGDDWDPDTVPDEDENEYEKPPKTQLHQPFLGAIGQTWWAMTPFEWSGIVRNVKQILTTWNEYVTFALPINQKNIHAEFEKNKYSSGFVSNPVDCVASVMWYPFDITLLLDATPADFVWGGTTQVIMSGVDEDGAPETTTTEQSLITGYLDNAYWLDGGFTDYFKHYKNFIDYQPYCTAELYIPYCGSVKIDPQQYVGHHLSVRYLIDFPTGACLALIYRDSLVVDSIAGQIGVTIAMSMPDYIEYGGRHMQAATNVKASKFQQLGTIWGTMGKALTGNIAGAVMGAPAISAGFETLKNAEYQLDNTLINQKSISTASPAISTGNEQVCRLVLYQPRWLEGYDQNSYGDYGHTTGFATIENKALGSFSGFTVADSIDTSGISQATEKEKAMIQKAFKGGVYM